MHAIELLKADHRKVEAYFEQYKANDDGDNKALFEKINRELTAHTHIEETIFYPKLKEDGDDDLKKIVFEGIEEHRQVKMFLRELGEMSVGDSDKFNAKLKVVVEDVEHHVEEEEGEMFAMCEEQFDSDVLEELGKAMEAEKASFNKSQKAAA